MDFFILWLKVSGALLVIFTVVGYIRMTRSEKKKREARAQRTADFLQNGRRPQARVELSMETTEAPDYPYSIKGINFCGLDDSYLGDFEGTARALKADKYDPFAIGVYIGSKRVGWLPKGNAELHGHILEAGGSVPCEGWISKGNDASHSFYYGRVDVLI